MLDSPELLNNPLCIQSAILNDYSAKLNGEVTVVDANNSFGFLIEGFSRIVSEATNAMDAKFSGLYPIRADTTKDLYNHLSDFDYVGFFSYPAPLKLVMMLHRDYLVKNAVKMPGSNYQLVVIPADTIFTVGRFKLGLYYPIHIKINSLIDTISASYDTTEANPLKTLATNSIQVKSNSFEGIDLVSIEFECYQFNKEVIVESVNPDIGYIKTYQYTDKFYAIRVFDISSGTKQELHYTLSDSIYDTDKPTVNLKIYPETNEISVALPQIYFTSGKVGRKLQLELYTTIGELDVSLTNLQLSDITANFAMASINTDLTYTTILKTIPTIIISPTDTRIIGGSNAETFAEMKDFTVYHNNALAVPITRMDLDRFFKKNGFTYMVKIDNLTDRRYYAYKKIFLNSDEIGVTCGGLTLLYNEDVPNKGVIYQNNNTIIVLPTVIFKYIEVINKFEIVDDTTTAMIKNAAGTHLADLLNSTDYFCNPHHIVITTLDRYPVAELYDLLTTTATDVTFIEENAYLSAQLSLINIMIRHLNSGAGGYAIRASVQRSADLVDVVDTDLNCYLTVETQEGFRIGIRGTYVGTSNGLDLFDFSLATNYKINNSAISITNLKTTSAAPAEYTINLSGTMHIATFVKKSLFPDISQDDVIINYITDDDNSWLSVSLQSFDYCLGSNLSDIIDSNLLTNWTNIQYKRYDTNIPLLYEHDVYETNTDGSLKYTINNTTGNIVTNKLHMIGDPVYDGSNVQVLKHRIGDTIVDVSGTPIQIASRIKDFTIDLSAYEYSRQVVTADFLITLASSISAYYDTIRSMNNDVLENTDIYFRPIITTNKGRYKINNNTVIESSLELEFVFNCYVAQAVLDDTTMIDAITNKFTSIIINHLTDEIISMTVISSDIKANLDTYINSIDVVSLNGDSFIQTLMNIDIDKSPKLGMKLRVGNDGRLTYVPKITINFKALDK